MFLTTLSLSVCACVCMCVCVCVKDELVMNTQIPRASTNNFWKHILYINKTYNRKSFYKTYYTEQTYKIGT